MATKRFRIQMYGDAKSVMKSRDPDHIITRGYVSYWKLNISFSIRLITPNLAEWGHMVARSHPWSHMTLWPHSQEFKMQYVLFGEGLWPPSMGGEGDLPIKLNDHWVRWSHDKEKFKIENCSIDNKGNI